MFKRIIAAILNGADVVLYIFLTVWWFSFIREIFSTPFSNEPNWGSGEIAAYFSREEIVFILLFVFLIVCIFLYASYVVNCFTELYVVKWLIKTVNFAAFKSCL